MFGHLRSVGGRPDEWVVKRRRGHGTGVPKQLMVTLSSKVCIKMVACFNWLVVYLPLWKNMKVNGFRMTSHILMENKQICLKPPTSFSSCQTFRSLQNQMKFVTQDSTLWMFQGSPAKKSPKNDVQGQRDTNEAQLSWSLRKPLMFTQKVGRSTWITTTVAMKTYRKPHEIQRCSRNAIDNYETPVKNPWKSYENLPWGLIFPAKSCNLWVTKAPHLKVTGRQGLGSWCGPWKVWQSHEIYGGYHGLAIGKP